MASDLVERLKMRRAALLSLKKPTKANIYDAELDAAAIDEIERLRKGDGEREAIPMLLFCPMCGIQHIDEPDERTPEWDNPPHRSHLCHACGTIWRPADVATVGVVRIETVGKADTWEESNSAAIALTTPNDIPAQRLKQAAAPGVQCPACDGEGCDICGQSGRVFPLTTTNDTPVRGLIETIEARRLIYVTKRDAANSLADDDCNRHERMAHTVEAFDLLLSEIAALTSKQTVSVDREAEFVAGISRLTRSGDDGWTPPDDHDDDRQALDRLIAAAREIRSAPPLDGENVE